MSERDAYGEDATPFLGRAAKPSTMDKEEFARFVGVTGCGCAKPMRERGVWMRTMEGWHFVKMTGPYFEAMRLREYDMGAPWDARPEAREEERKAAKELAPHYTGQWFATGQCPEALAKWQNENQGGRAERSRGRQKLHA